MCEGNVTTRTNGMPVDSGVRERLRAAQRAEAEATSAVQKALAAEADARARLDQVILKHQAELSKTARAVQAAQASLVRTSGLERAAVLLDVSSKVLKSAVRETEQDARAQATAINTPAQHSS
jgi:hypothetical protein